MRYDPDAPARVCYAALRQLREEQRSPRGPVWGLLLREEQDWYRHWAGWAAAGWPPDRIQGEWLREMTVLGWTWGPEIDHVKKTHPELRPWHELGDAERRRFFVVQMNVIGMCLPIPPATDTRVPVTVP